MEPENRPNEDQRKMPIGLGVILGLVIGLVISIPIGLAMANFTPAIIIGAVAGLAVGIAIEEHYKSGRTLSKVQKLILLGLGMTTIVLIYIVITLI